MKRVRQSQPLRLLGVDPGDAWCGLAALEIDRDHWSAWTGVLHVTNRTLPEIVHEVMRCSPMAIVIEKYQSRAVGHQKWNVLRTPRLIGALEYAAFDYGMGWHEVAPDAAAKVRLMPIYPTLQHWQPHWQTYRRAEWEHSHSAWRILSQWMMGTLKELSGLLHQNKNPKHNHFELGPVNWLGDPETVADRDLTATPAHWTIPR
jgi:hypothetical protein